MRYQAGALLTGARSELIRRAGVLADGSRIVAAGPPESLAADHALPLVVARGVEYRPAPHRFRAGAPADPAGPGPR
jgi:hypothetical protein